MKRNEKLKNRKNSRRVDSQKSKFVEPYLNKDGYNEVILEKDGKKEKLEVAFLVAQTFVPNPNKLPYVKHINGIKTDDRAVNLMWSSEKE